MGLDTIQGSIGFRENQLSRAPAEHDAAGFDAAGIERYHGAMNGSAGYLIHEGLQHVWGCVQRGNEYVDRNLAAYDGGTT